MRHKIAVAALAMLALAACSKKPDGQIAAAHAPAAAVPPPAGKQWTDVVSFTPDGGYLMGNPAAPVKLVEYASYTCPHCKHFEETGADPLKSKYVSTGKVSWEFRSFLIHAPDAPITLLMNCRGAEPFFPLAQQLYAAQDAIMNKLIAMPAAEQQRLTGLAPVDNFKAQAEAEGLYGFFGARGLPRAQADACLSDQKALDRLTAWQNKVQDAGINSTPTFIINGVTWQETPGELWPQLDTALGQAVG